MSDPTETPGGPDSRPDPRTDIRGYLSDFEQRMTSLQEKATESTARLGEVSATATSENGEVTVVVGPGGALTDILFGRSMRMSSPETLSHMAKDAYDRARQEAAEKARAIMSETLGENSPAMRAFSESTGPEGGAR